METVTVSKKAYQELVEKKFRYEYLLSLVKGDVFVPPPLRNVGEIISALSATKRYNRKFLESLRSGLMRSSYFRS